MSQLINHLLEEHDGHFTMLYQVDFQEDKVVYTVKKEVNSPCSCRPEVTWMIQEPQEPFNGSASQQWIEGFGE